MAIILTDFRIFRKIITQIGDILPDIRPRECIKKYCPYTPPREKEQVMSFNIVPAVLIIKKGPEIKQSSRVDIFVDLGKLNYCIGIHL